MASRWQENETNPPKDQRLLPVVHLHIYQGNYPLYDAQKRWINMLLCLMTYGVTSLFWSKNSWETKVMQEISTKFCQNVCCFG